MLKPCLFPDHEAVSRRAADLIVEQVQARPNALFCLATGKTPMRTYELLAARGRDEPRLFEQARIVNLDEWQGLPTNDSATCGRQLRDALITPLGLGDRYIAFQSQPADAIADCARVAAWLAAHGPIDTCVLGLGINGHIGFNEPGECLLPHAHIAQLSHESLSHAMIGQCGTRPTGGLTLGMVDLMHSSRIFLLVTGASKRDILKQLLSGRITTDLPASMLHLHPNAHLLVDAAANEAPT